jgi:long-chain acyl-CoA synthetase
MLLLPNIPQAVICLYGTLKAGGVAVLSDPLAAADAVAEKVRDCRPRFVVVVRPVLPALLDARVPVEKLILTRVRDYLPTLRGAFVSLFDRKGSVVASRIPNLVYMRDMLRDGQGNRPSPAPHPLAVLAYTSGTVGRPRAVMLTHRNLVANTLQVRLLYVDAQEGRETLLAAVPFAHSFGLSAMSLAVSLAGNMLLMPRFKSHDALQLISRHRPTLFPGVPAMYVSLVNHPLVKQFHLGSIRACVSGAAPLAVEVREAFERLTKGRLVEGYGLTEASPVTHANPLRGAGRPATIGVPLPGTDARIVDAAGGELRPGQIGELEVRGPQVMAGYWEREEETRAVLHDGWLRTGDLATMDEDGYFQVICRKQEVIHIGGRVVYPRDVEEVLYEHPKVREAAVIGVLVEGQVALRAHVVLRFAERATESEIVDFCRHRLSPWKVPEVVKFERQLPRSAVGKILRRLL